MPSDLRKSNPKDIANLDTLSQTQKEQRRRKLGEKEAAFRVTIYGTIDAEGSQIALAQLDALIARLREAVASWPSEPGTWLTH